MERHRGHARMKVYACDCEGCQRVEDRGQQKRERTTVRGRRRACLEKHNNTDTQTETPQQRAQRADTEREREHEERSTQRESAENEEHHTTTTHSD